MRVFDKTSERGAWKVWNEKISIASLVCTSYRDKFSRGPGAEQSDEVQSRIKEVSAFANTDFTNPNRSIHILRKSKAKTWL